MAEEIQKTQGFDIQMNESLIQSQVNPIQKLTYEDYVHHLTYFEPLTDGCWDIPLSPNTTYFPIFESFDL